LATNRAQLDIFTTASYKKSASDRRSTGKTDSACNLDPAAEDSFTVRHPSRLRHILVGICTALLGTSIIAPAIFFIGVPADIRVHVYWFSSSEKYKSAVDRSSRIPDQLPHAGTADWMGYLVFDPSDWLRQTSTVRQPRKVKGIPCDVVAVRRLERNWYSVVTGMNQFSDSGHPNC
jgi:hypothetical protein